MGVAEAEQVTGAADAHLRTEVLGADRLEHTPEIHAPEPTLTTVRLRSMSASQEYKRENSFVGGVYLRNMASNVAAGKTTSRPWVFSAELS